MILWQDEWTAGLLLKNRYFTQNPARSQNV
jgi:hypothetical protein